MKSNALIWSHGMTECQDSNALERRHLFSWLLSSCVLLLLLLLLSHFSRVRLCDPRDGSPPSLGFSRQEHWSRLPFPFPVHESEKWKWSHSVVSDSQRPLGLQPSRLLRPWDLPGKSTGVGCHCLLRKLYIPISFYFFKCDCRKI